MVLKKQQFLTKKTQTDKNEVDAVIAAYRIGAYDLAEKNGLRLFLLFAGSFLFGLVTALVLVGFWK